MSAQITKKWRDNLWWKNEIMKRKMRDEKLDKGKCSKLQKNQEKKKPDMSTQIKKRKWEEEKFMNKWKN